MANFARGFSFDHDFAKYPELTNTQMSEIGFSSPHEQITEDFEAFVVKVHDGDTITLRAEFRDFDFPLRFLSIDAPELNTGAPGEEARDFVKELIEGETVTIKVNRNNRVDKYGRLLGDPVYAGIRVADIMLQFGYALPFGRRREGEIPDINRAIGLNMWKS